MAGGESEAAAASERLSADQCARFLLHLFHILVSDRAHVGRQRIEHTPGEREWLLRALRGRGEHDFRSRKEAGRNPGVHLIAANLPASADDSAGGVIEPGAGAADLDLLSARQPEAAFDQCILENDRDILEILVDQRRPSEAERHPHDFTALAIDINSADSAWLAIVFGPHPHFIDIEHSRAETNLQRIPNRVVVLLKSDRRERMRNILNFVALADPDDVSEVVLDDAEVVAMVVDIGGKEQRVATAHDPLLAQVGSAPIDFQPQLVRLHDLWRLGESFSKLCEEGHIPVCSRLVIDESSIGELIRPALGCALDECAGARIVPGLLSAELARGDDDNEDSDSRAKLHGGKLVAG